jgi:hypothetical protein
VTQLTSAATRHLAINRDGYRVNKEGEVVYENNRKRKASLVIQQLHRQHNFSQGAVNDLITAYNTSRFLQAVVNWIGDNNHPLREIETPSFREMIKAANRDAEADLWPNHQSIHDYILRDFNVFLPAVIGYIASSPSKKSTSLSMAGLPKAARSH